MCIVLSLNLVGAYFAFTDFHKWGGITWTPYPSMLFSTMCCHILLMLEVSSQEAQSLTRRGGSQQNSMDSIAIKDLVLLSVLHSVAGAIRGFLLARLTMDALNCNFLGQVGPKTTTLGLSYTRAYQGVTLCGPKSVEQGVLAHSRTTMGY
jgi:hypothetical protein